MKINRILIANRGEIAIRIMRAAKELGIETIAIFSEEDMASLHRQKADESYLIGVGKEPTDAYLATDEIIQLAKDKNIDAIHPGYGFLSENQEFAQKCQDEGIIFVGPTVDQLNMFGNKSQARATAEKAGLPLIPGSPSDDVSINDVETFAKSHGFPIIIKAVSGGGGRGMRVVHQAEEIADAYNRCKSEAATSFGNDRLYVEKFIDQPKHIEVQVIGDTHGNVVHLYERDCSIQRRHQKVVEVAPSYSLSDNMRQKLTDASLQLMQTINYVNAGTVEFLVSGDKFYFMEVNPRIQVEHTITELITGVDLVKAQILVAQGESLFGDKIKMPRQEDLKMHGYAIQCRVTTEDPLNNFSPDTGRIIGYQSPGGFGVRLDAGDAFEGAVISPYYDSLLVKISTFAADFRETVEKMERALSELKISGVKTNIRFLRNIMVNEDFLEGDYHTDFIDSHNKLFEFKPSRDRGNKILKYLANITVNGFPGIEKTDKPIFPHRPIPTIDGSGITVYPNSFSSHHYVDLPIDKSRPTIKNILDQSGPEAVIQQILKEKDVLLTDTTLRDAHQSLLTTRIRTKDMLSIAPFMNESFRDYFSIEMWGGATFDVAYNFLKEDPWTRLAQLRQAMPDLAFQMLLRASNAVGYKNYPDNVLKEFITCSAQQGIDIFRIFDSLNWIEAMKYPIEVALETGKLVEGAISYTGDVLNPERSSLYTLDYYVDYAKTLESLGVHLIAIKDMSGVLKPEAAYQLVKALKENVSVPIHLHTHDTSGNALQTYSRAIDAGVDIVDTANQSISGLIAQPSGNALYYAREGTTRQIKTNLQANVELSKYWDVTRQYYKPFETKIKHVWPEVYDYEMPGGQYSNLEMQAKSVGLGDRYDEVQEMYRRVNFLFGDIIKVTPSSKVVGDMALFMVQNDLNETTVIEEGMNLDFPQSVVEFFRGDIGQPVGPMNKELQKVVLKDIVPYSDRPGNHLAPYNFEAAKRDLAELYKIDFNQKNLLSYALYPKVYLDFLEFVNEFGLVDVIDTPSFFYGMVPGEIRPIEIESGKVVLIQLNSVGPIKEDGTRTVYFKLNGMNTQIEVEDINVTSTSVKKAKADRTNPNHIGAQMPGTVFSIEVKEGDCVEANDTLIITEAMKMETTIQSPKAAVVKRIHCNTQDQIEAGDLLIELEDK